MQKWQHQKNRHTKALHEKKAIEWDNKTKDLSFKLHPLKRAEGQLRSYYPCGHHIHFASRPCHEKQQDEMLKKKLI